MVPAPVHTKGGIVHGSSPRCMASASIKTQQKKMELPSTPLCITAPAARMAANRPCRYFFFNIYLSKPQHHVMKYHQNIFANFRITCVPTCRLRRSSGVFGLAHGKGIRSSNSQSVPAYATKLPLALVGGSLASALVPDIGLRFMKGHDLDMSLLNLFLNQSHRRPWLCSAGHCRNWISGQKP